MGQTARANMLRATALLELAFAPAPPGKPRVAPTEFRVFAPGDYVTTHRTTVFTEQSAALIMAAWKDYGNPLSFDYGHSFFEEESRRDPADQYKSAGLFKLEVRQGELWATDIKWTPTAKKGIEDGDYPFTSPAFTYDEETGEITGLLNIALTATPATKSMKPLCATRAKPEDETQEPPPMKTLLAALALSATATEAEALDVVSKMQGSQKDLLELCDAKSASEARGKIAGWKEAAAQTSALLAEREAAKATAAKVEIASLLDGALKAGKIGKNQVALLASQGEKDPAFLKAYLAELPQRMPNAVKEPALQLAELSTLTDEDTELASLLGVDKKALAAQKLKVGDRIPTRVISRSEAEAE